MSPAFGDAFRGKASLEVAVRSCAEALLDFLYPPKCLLCSRVGSWLCDECIDAFPQPEPPTCDNCGDPLPTNARCRRCERYLAPIQSASFAAVYAEGARDVVRKLKYDGKRCLAAPMAALMEFRLRTRSALQGADCIVPVALHPKKLRQRGYNQSAWLAEELATLCGLPVLDALERTRETRTQVGLASAERQANMAGAFRAETGCAGRHVLLVDDVTTTGATAREAARALLDASCASVRLLTFARDL